MRAPVPRRHLRQVLLFRQRRDQPVEPGEVCFQAALSGESFVKRAIIAWPCRKASRAFALSPDCRCTNASLPKLIARSRCHSALPGSDFARRSADGEAVLVGFQRADEVALRLLHVANQFRRTERSRFHFVLAGSRRVSASVMSSPAWWDTSAPARSPCATSTSPILFRRPEIPLPARVAGVEFRQPFV